MKLSRIALAKKFFCMLFVYALSVSAYAAVQNGGGSVDDLKIGKLAGNGTVNNSGEIFYPPGFLDGPKDTDVMYRLLSMALGDVVRASTRYLAVPVAGADADVSNVTVLTSVLMVGPGVAIILGGILGVYFVFAGLINTGRDGMFLGQRWDSWFTPLRLGLSVAGLLPAPGFGGMANIQVIVLALSLLGIGMGSSVWAYYADKQLSVPVMYVQPTATTAFAEDLIKAQMCLIIENDFTTDSRRLDPYQTTSYTHQDNWFTTDMEVMKMGKYCGAIKIKSVEKSVTEFFDDLFYWDGDSQIVYNTVYDAMLVQQKTSLATLYSDLSPIALTLTDDTATDQRINAVAPTFMAAITKYDAALQKAAFDTIKGTDVEAKQAIVKKTISDLGFLMAGSYQYYLQAFQDQLYSAVNDARPSVEYSTENALESSLGTMEMAEAKFSQADDRLKKMFAAISLSSYDLNGSLTSSKVIFGDQSGEWASWTSRLSAAIAEELTQVSTMKSDITDDMPDPIMEVKHLGNRLQAGTLAARLFINKLADGDSVFGDIDDAPDAIAEPIKQFMQWVMTDVIPLLQMTGFVCSNIIPALPFIMFTMAAMGYILYLIEAYFACSFWLAMHGTPEGHAVTGNGASGYPIVLTLILRPTLMIFGIAAANTVIRIIGWLIKQTTFPSIEMMNVGGYNLTSFLGQLLVYAALMAAAIYKSYALTYELPNAILRWMGVGQHHADLGEVEGMQRTTMIGNNMTKLSTSGLGKAAATGNNVLKGGGGGGGEGGEGGEKEKLIR